MDMTSANLSAQAELQEDLRSEIVRLVVPVTTVAGLIILLLDSPGRQEARAEAIGFGLMVLPLSVWLMLGHWPKLRNWLLVISYVLLGGLIMALTNNAAPGLLAVSVGLAAIMVSPGAGCALASLLTLILIAPNLPWAGSLDGISRAVAVALLWATEGFIWVVLRYASQVMESSRARHERIVTLLEEARDQRVGLKQAQEQLLLANRELARVSNHLNEMRHAADEARRIKEQFVANVSHELRTPLNMILGFSEMILSAPQTYGGSIPPKLLADLRIVLRNSQHLSSLINDVLDLSQVEAGRWALTKEHVPVAEIVESTVEAVRPLFESKGLYLVQEVQEDLPALFCDRTRIREVLLNLLSNAGRFTRKGGVRLGVWQDGHEIAFRVVDTGPGIAPEQRERIFLPFEQVDGSIRRSHGGSGLGLSISKAFVELHGGKIWFESVVDQGTTFHVRLPISPPEAIASGPERWFHRYLEYSERRERPSIPLAPTKLRFVVLEQEPVLAHLLGRYMDGTEIASVTSWEQAMAELQGAPNEALLVNDPVLGVAPSSGETLEGLPEGMPVLYCSIPGPQETARPLDIIDYLVKPVSREQLLGTLGKLEPREKTVLVVDDDSDTLQLFQRMLSTAAPPCRVLRASNGRQALRLLEQQRPDVILLDLVMPDMDGFRFLQLRRADPRLHEIPVVVISQSDPTGHPIVSPGLCLKRGGGLSVAQVLACIESLCAIAGPAAGVRAPRPSQTRSG